LGWSEPEGCGIIGSGVFENERMFNVPKSASPAGGTSRSSPVAASGPDDGIEFPGRRGGKLLSASPFVLSSATFAVWAGWRVISLMLEFTGVR
jgi:hypothetical protein